MKFVLVAEDGSKYIKSAKQVQKPGYTNLKDYEYELTSFIGDAKQFSEKEALKWVERLSKKDINVSLESYNVGEEYKQLFGKDSEINDEIEAAQQNNLDWDSLLEEN